MRFVDEVELHLTAGAGGDGKVAFRRESHVPRGGPAGGDGGNGGSIVFVSGTQNPTLLDVRSRYHYRAEDGGHGGTSRCHGKSGQDLVIPVPAGTQIYDAITGELLADLVDRGSKFVAVRGGRGGHGNAHFATPVRRTPDFARPGRPGQIRRVVLKLKVIADVGLIGLPNVGKSTLITRISASKATVADYPFTTLVPNLGVVSSGLLGSFVVADIPGLIEGAHAGAGLGHQFLRHVERAPLLVHVVSAVSEAGVEHDLDVVSNELRQYLPELVQRPTMLVLNKIDTIERHERAAFIQQISKVAHMHGLPFAAVSCVTGEGLKSFQQKLERLVFEHMPRQNAETGYDPLAV